MYLYIIYSLDRLSYIFYMCKFQYPDRNLQCMIDNEKSYCKKYKDWGSLNTLQLLINNNSEHKISNKSQKHNLHKDEHNTDM